MWQRTEARAIFLAMYAPYYGLCNSSGSLAMLAAIRRASSLESNFAADLRPGSFSRRMRVAVCWRRARRNGSAATRQSKAAGSGGRYFETNVGPIEDIKTRDDVFPSLLLA